MISTLTQESGFPWSDLQQPVHATRVPVCYLRLFSALADGWQAVEALRIFASGKNNEGDSYLVTLMHPQRMQTRQVRVRSGAQIKQLLTTEQVPLV